MEMISILDITQFELDKSQKDFFVNKLPVHIFENQSKITKPHKHNSYLTILFTKGSGRHEIDFNSYEIKPGAVFLLAPGQTHHRVNLTQPEPHLTYSCISGVIECGHAKHR